MPRQRMVKPEFFTSESITSLPSWARLLFIGMWVFSDDYGNMRLNVRRIRINIFPDDDFTDENVSEWLSALEENGCIKVYEVEGESFIHIPNFTVYQTVKKPSASTIPRPPETLSEVKVTHHFNYGEQHSPDYVMESPVDKYGSYPQYPTSTPLVHQPVVLKERKKEGRRRM